MSQSVAPGSESLFQSIVDNPLAKALLYIIASPIIGVGMMVVLGVVFVVVGWVLYGLVAWVGLFAWVGSVVFGVSFNSPPPFVLYPSLFGGLACHTATVLLAVQALER